MSNLTKNKVAIVTGGTKGIGLGITKLFLKNGLKVITFSRKKILKKHFKSHFKEDFNLNNLISLSCNFKNYKSLAIKINKANKLFGSIDILVNNIGGSTNFVDWKNVTQKDFLSSFNLNVISMFNFIKASEKYLLKSNSPRIINIGSISAIQPGKFNPHYASMKSAVLNLSKYLSNYYAPKININCINPGTIESFSLNEMIKKNSKKNKTSFAIEKKKFIKNEIKKIPINKIGSPEDVANLALYLCSDKSNWITGSVFEIDGGKYKGIH